MLLLAPTRYYHATSITRSSYCCTDGTAAATKMLNGQTYSGILKAHGNILILLVGNQRFSDTHE